MHSLLNKALTHCKCCESVIRRDKLTRSQRRKSDVLRSTATVIKDLQKNIEGWEVSSLITAMAH